MWGIDPEDSGEPKAAAADFSSLTLEQKHDWVTAAVLISYVYHERIRLPRYRKKKLVAKDEWFSYLTKEELMMMGGLDQEEADNIFTEEPYKCLSLESRLRKKKYEQWINELIREQEEGNNKLFNQSDEGDTKFNQSDEGETKFNMEKQKQVSSSD